MQLTESQLDIAARKLCELCNELPDEDCYGITNLEINRRYIERVVRSSAKGVAAIIHAVTSETCNWQWDDEFDIWRLECDEVLQKFVIDADEMEFRFCPYCGKTIAFVSQQKDEVSE